MVFLKIFCGCLLINCFFLFCFLLYYFIIAGVIIFNLLFLIMDIVGYTYDEEEPSDDIGERFLWLYEVYFSFLLEWEREYWAYYLDDFDDENGDTHELDEFELTEAPFIAYSWYFRLRYRLGYFLPSEESSLRHLKLLQFFDLVKREKHLKRGKYKIK